jgi:hypothetical protein
MVGDYGANGEAGMRLKIVFAAMVLASAGLMAPPAARAAVVPQDAAVAPSPRQLELTRRYIDLTMSEQFEDSIREMIIDQAEIDPNARDLPDEDRRFIAELTAELTTDLIPQMLDAMTPVYARTFTEEELEAMIAFYDTELGHSIVEKTMVAMPEANRAAMTVIPQLLDKMAARICQHYGCEPGQLERLQSEMRGETVAAPRPK